MTNAIGHSTCAVTNVTCICTNQALNDEVTACITAGCTVKEALSTGYPSTTGVVRVADTDLRGRAAAKNVTSQLYGVPVTTDNTLIPLYLVFIGLAVVAVIIRIIARVVTHAYFWWDDFSNFFGFVGRRLPSPTAKLALLTRIRRSELPSLPSWPSYVGSPEAARTAALDSEANRALAAVDTGQGKDIWFVPFDNITKILQVGQSQPQPAP